MRGRTSGQIHKATRYQQGNVAAFESGAGMIRTVKMPKKEKGRRGGGKKGTSKERELNDTLKAL